MKRVIAVGALLTLLAAWPGMQASAQSAGPTRSVNWSAAEEISSGWETRPDLNTDGTAVVALNAHPDVADGQKQIVYFERTAAGWAGPQVVANNGVAQQTGMLPQYTHPLLSGNGRTIAYLGATGQNPPYAIYLLDRVDSTWGAAYSLPTDLNSPRYRLALSDSGNAVVYNSYWLIPVIWPMYVSNRAGGVWTAPYQLSDAGGGSDPTMSADGMSVAYLAANQRLMFVEKIFGDWMTPVLLVDNDPDQSTLEYPVLSADGRAVFFWKVQLTPAGGFYDRTAQDLYVLRRQGSGWTAPLKVTATPVIPNTPTDAPAATDAHGTRVIYSRPQSENGSIIGATLEMTEFDGGVWTAPVAVTDFKSYASDKYPQLSTDGNRLIYQADHYLYDGTHGLREKTTAVAPVPLSQPAVVTGTVGGAATTFVAGSTVLTLPTNTFTSTVLITYTQLAFPAALPTDPLVPAEYEFELSAGYGDASQPAAVAPSVNYLIAIDYAALESSPVSRTTLQLYRWDGAGWTQEGITHGAEVTGARFVANVDRLGRFAVFGMVKTQRLYLPLIFKVAACFCSIF